jgi:hypothetical protein
MWTKAASRSVDVLDEGARAVSTAGGFRVPLTLVILVLDGLRVAWDFLLLGGGFKHMTRSSQRPDCVAGVEGLELGNVDLRFAI